MDSSKNREVERKSGRPRAIPEELIPKVLTLYSEGSGYRAIARELRQDGVSVDWSTVRRLVKGSWGFGHPPERP